ncbi:MAG: serine/threonine-protein kinase [Candidatus Solibacter usitatus]|nr:serine/threonine-protein kinase [Candidatus Solibacter usitatus]
MTKPEMLGHYRLQEKLGEGGMGVVYKAFDTHLDRPVAIKILPADKVHDLERKRRFVQEAKAASALNHPNIVTIYDIDKDQGADYIAMEFIDGKTLEDLVPRNGMRLKDAVSIAVQVADALSKAHAAGITHRDLKPSNIMVDKEGRAKVLDFGLAKLTDLTETGPNDKTVLARPKSVEGAIMGTPHYMSPEQAEGQKVDSRTDMFSFGTVLYEMLTGKSAFSGDTVVSVLAAVLNKEPTPLHDIAPETPYDLRKVIQLCLRKDRSRRVQHMDDIKLLLEDLKADLVTGVHQTTIAPQRLPRNTIHLFAGLFLLGVLLCVSALRWSGVFRSAAVPNRTAFAQLTDGTGPDLFPSLSPDGKYIAYASSISGNWDIYLQRIEDQEKIKLTQDSTADDTQPAFSPDGQSIAFRSTRAGGGIFVMSRAGGGLRQVAKFGYNPAWSPNGRQIVFAEEGIARPEDRSNPLSRLWVADLVTGKQWTLGEIDGVQPHWSPHGQRIAYWAIDKRGQRDIWTIPAQGGLPIRVTQDEFIDWSPAWSPDGAKLYFASNRGSSMNLWRVAIHESTGRVTGSPEPVTTPSAYSGMLSFSTDKQRLAFSRQSFFATVNRVSFDPTVAKVLGEAKPVTSPENRAERPSLSPDNDWLAFNSSGPNEAIFVMNVDGSHLKQLTSGRIGARGSRWSPDGRRLALFSNASGNREISTVDRDGNGLQQVTFHTGLNVTWPVYDPSGTQLAYTIFGSGSYLLDLRRDWKSQQPKSLQYSGGGEIFSAWNWSPDGKRLAGFVQRKDGSYEGLVLYDLGAARFEKITEYGADPVWLSDNRRLLFLHNGNIHMVDSATHETRQIFSIAPQVVARRGFAISKDDRQIYFSVVNTEANVWLALLDD